MTMIERLYTEQKNSSDEDMFWKLQEKIDMFWENLQKERERSEARMKRKEKKYEEE